VTVDAYPLTWPEGWRRTPALSRTHAQFGKGERTKHTYSDSYYTRKRDLTVNDGVRRVLDSLGRMGVQSRDIIISSNVVLRLDGLPRSGQRMPDDPGVAVYWQKRVNGKLVMRSMAVDRYKTVADNLAAIAATLEAMRAIERHGGAEILDRAFTGFTALPAPEQPWQVLGVPMTASNDEIEDAYRRLAMKNHPDRGGDDAAMSRINAARDAMHERMHQL
jgi:hypothetical protein